MGPLPAHLTPIDEAAAVQGLSRRHQLLLDYWKRLTGDRPYPDRRDLDVVELRDLLPFICLLDVLPAPEDYRFRVMGTEVVNFSAKDFTGLKASEIPFQRPGSSLWALYHAVATDAKPILGTIPYVGPMPGEAHVKVLALPLSHGGSGVGMLLCLVEFGTRRESWRFGQY